MRLQEITAFANNPRNRIMIHMCARNAYKFYKMYKNEGACIYSGTADYYEGGVFIKTVNHYWNVINYIKPTGECYLKLVDIYNYKLYTNDVYRNHIGKQEHIDIFKDCYRIYERLKRQAIHNKSWY